MWRWAAVRSAGLPVERILALASPDCAAAADRLLEEEARAEAAARRAVDAARLALAAAAQEERAAVGRALRLLKRRRVPAALGLAELDALVAEHAAAQAEAAAATAEFERAFEAAIAAGGRALYEAAADETFREALAWQNRHALQTGVEPLRRRPPDSGPRDSHHRAKETLVASYLQRYCAKNDTIGFFGPVGWLRVADEGPALAARPGPSLLASRQVYFEGWCLDALGEALAAREPRLLAWAAPRRMPWVRADETSLHLPLAKPIRLSPAQAAVLRACDGVRPARELAALLLAAGVPGLRTEAEVFAILESLRASRRIAWALETPSEGLYPERSFRAQLERVGDERLREPALAALTELEERRAAVAAAAGDARRVERAIEAMETTFQRLTGGAATRRAGETYAGRTLVYEDSRRDVEVRLGPELVTALGPPLSLVLASARWYTYTAATLYRESFRHLYGQLAARQGGRTVPFPSFWLYAQPVLFEEPEQPRGALLRGLQERWAAILALPAHERRVTYSAAELRDSVAASFDVPHAGWPAVRHCSPDLMIAAESAEAVSAGRFELVLGEVHPGINTLRSALFPGQHPSPEELRAAMDADLPEPVVLVVASRQPGGVTMRLSNGLPSAKDVRLVFAPDTCDVQTGRPLPLSELVVEDEGGSLVVRTHDGGVRMDVMEVLGELVALRVVNQFDMLPAAPHTPRVTVDRLVVSRERWRFPAPDLTFATAGRESERFLAARRWRREHDLPRFVFVRTPLERKPFLVDFESPVSLEVLGRAVRRSAASAPAGATIAVTEMLPDPDRAWLADAAGRRYVSELRFVVVDRR